MKVFTKVLGGEEKVNFVDENDVFVGYSMESDCCENFGWFINAKVSTTVIPSKTEIPGDLEGWVFDKDYIKKLTPSCVHEGGMVVFRMVKGDEEKFLHLFNCQNGCYNHGFSFGIGNATKHEGSI